MDSIKMASGHFFEFLLEYDHKTADKKKNIEFSFYKYFSRAATRSVPFGMFSGIGLLDLCHKEINTSEGYTEIRGKISYSYLDQIVKRANENRTIRMKLSYSLNNTFSINQKGEAVYIQKDLQSVANGYIKNSVENDEVMSSIFEFCQKERSMAEFIHFLTETFKVTEDEGLAFFDDLLEESIIFSNLKYSSLGSHYLANDVLELIISDELKQDDPSLYKDLLDIFELQTKGLTGKTLDQQIHYDLYFQGDQGISPKIATEVEDILLIYEKLSQNFDTKPAVFEIFIDAFIKKYGEREIPLLEVLSLDDRDNIGMTGGSHLQLGKSESLILKKMFEGAREGKIKIDLEKQDLVSFSGTVPDTGTKYCSVSLFNDHDSSKRTISINYLSYASPLKILGRFTADRKIRNFADEIQEYEKTTLGPDFIWAEIEHLPTHLAGQIVQRNIQCEYIIRYPNDSPSYSHQKYIDIHDLSVSIIDSRVYLRSKKYNKYVIPRFSAFFDAKHPVNSPIFSLLLDIGAQFDNKEKSGIPIDKVMKISGFFPRICYRNHILKKAHWRVEASEFFKNKNENPEVSMQSYKKNAERLGINPSFCIVEGENELYINENIPVSIELFLKELKKKGSLVLCEVLYDEYIPFSLSGEKEKVLSEIIFAFKNKALVSHSSLSIPEDIKVPGKLFPFMDDCIYLKLFISKKDAAPLISDLIPYLNQLAENGILSHFVYLYYYSPDFHIRLRIFSSRPMDAVHELSAFLKEKQNDIDQIQYTTYDREMRRYSGDHILFFEKLHHLDSLVAHQTIKETLEGNAEELFFCLRTALYYIDSMYDSWEEKISYVKKIKNAFGSELRAGPDTSRYVHKIFSENKENIAFILESEFPETDRILKEIRLQIRTAPVFWTADTKEAQIFNLIHMHIMRIVKQNNRFFEFVLYSVLEKKLNEILYRSQTVEKS
ncbi:thiopeptide-type bacteriocin biosynthesis protein [Chryseobacterium sp.]|uniref:thiopeptide-type bacteriocin biosynthesis protein n=1 Tax=Chryseobacterium sp. TaxID=1871047 RepID=UPI0025BC403B|nr:thiopeptide-type bacteriocin biosynthesis protein [Chryseobacterium sp.]MBV8327113.1 thiopeptide-type bacteriocin biosynthesis protein [Chryseobacterium sp.]